MADRREETDEVVRIPDGDDERPSSTADLLDRNDDQTDAGSPTDDGEVAPLLPKDDAEGLMARWQEIQVRFVDDPRDAVSDADGLVAELIDRLTRGFADERSELEGRWEQGSEVSTEDLRVALQRYRSFFQRLLAA
jgi:hypothetical protein